MPAALSAALFGRVLAVVLATAPEVAVERDIAYGQHPTLQSLDIYRPIGGEGLPVMVFIHGGGWSEGDKGVHPRKGRFFARAGFVYVTLNYRLSPAVRHPAHADDIAQAMGWVRANVAKHGGDPSRIFLVGHSAGAHLAALFATDKRRLQAAGVDASHLRGVALLDGSSYDLVTRVPASRGWSRDRYLQAFGDDPAVWQDASPVRHVVKDRSYPPFLLFHVASRKASTVQAAVLASAVKGVGGVAEVVAVTDRNHVTIARRLGLEGDMVAQRLLEFAHARSK